MELHPYRHYHHHEIEALRHHHRGLVAVRFHCRHGREVFPYLERHGAILAEIREHGHLVGFLLDPRIHLPHMNIHHAQPLHLFPGINLGVVEFLPGYEVYYEEHHHHHEGILHELGEAVFGERHEEHHHHHHHKRHEEHHHHHHHHDRW